MERDLEERREQARRLAGELRRVIERLSVVDPPADDLVQAADAAKRFADRLETMPSVGDAVYEGFAETSIAGTPKAFFDRSPLIGAANPLAAPVHLEVAAEGEKQWVEGSAVFGSAYEGPPGHLHGGFVAAAFDEVLGYAQTLSGNVGMTGTLTIRYRKPTPLHTELRFRAWVDRVEGRKIFVAGTCHAGGVLTAEADAIFISIDFERFAKVMGERQRRREGRKSGGEGSSPK